MVSHRTVGLPVRVRTPTGPLVGWVFSLGGAMTLLLLVALAGVAAGVYLSWRAGLEERIVTAYYEADTLYRAGDFAAARRAFGRTLELIVLLGRRDHYLAAEVRRKHEEARVVTDLLPISLEELARRAEAAPSAEAWQAAFARAHRGRTVIFDTRLLALPDAGGRQALAVGYEVGAAGGSRLGLDLTNCLLFTRPAWRPGDRAVFAATLAAMTPSGSGGTWVLHFDREGYLVIGDERLLRAAGLEVDDDVADAIARQRALVEGSGK